MPYEGCECLSTHDGHGCVLVLYARDGEACLMANDTASQELSRCRSRFLFCFHALNKCPNLSLYRVAFGDTRTVPDLLRGQSNKILEQNHMDAYSGK